MTPRQVSRAVIALPYCDDRLARQLCMTMAFAAIARPVDKLVCFVFSGGCPAEVFLIYAGAVPARMRGLMPI
jgi:hypothetical protein